MNQTVEFHSEVSEISYLLDGNRMNMLIKIPKYSPNLFCHNRRQDYSHQFG